MAHDEESHGVVLYVYDLSQGLARQLSYSLIGAPIEGIWHTSVIVYGLEYYYSGGIVSSPPERTPYGRPVKVIDIGKTQVPKNVFEEFLKEISPRFTAETYNLLQHNCNNFSNEVTQFLLGADIPQYILRLPQDVLSSPMGFLINPMIEQMEQTLRYGGVPRMPQAAAAAVNPSQGVAVAASVTKTGRGADSTTTTSIAAVKDPAKAKTETPVSTKVVAAARDQEQRKASKIDDARAKVQEEITREFAELMAGGGLRASEAAALAARRVMERHGIGGSGAATPTH